MARSVLTTSKHSCSKGNKSNNKYKSSNPKKQKKQKKQQRTLINHAPSPKLLYAVYDSNITGNCAYVCMANNQQIDVGSCVHLRASDGSAIASFENEFLPRMTDLPEIDDMFHQLTVHACVAGEETKDNYMGMMSKNYYYRVRDDDTSLPVQLPTIDDGTEEGGSVDTNLRVFDGLRDYLLPAGANMPFERVIKLAINTPPYHRVCIFANNHRIPFQNLVKDWLIIRIWVQTHPQASPEPHFASLHRREENFYGFGGERNATVFKISERFLARAFWEFSEGLLNLIAGGSWHNVSWTDPNNPEDEMDTFNVFVPKLFLRPVCRAWDNLSFQQIAGLDALLHPVIQADDDFPDGHKLAYRVVDLNLDRVTDGDDFLGLSVLHNPSAADDESRQVQVAVMLDTDN